MRFLSIYKAVERNSPPSSEEIGRMGDFIEEMIREGKLISTEGCLPTVKGARVRKSGSKITVTDGPFAESKEVIAGFALIEAASKEEAIELGKRFLEVAGDGESEIRQIATAEDFGAEFTPEQREKEDRMRAQLAAQQ